MMKTVEKERSRVHSTVAAIALPLEIILWEILIRLPAKAVLRCRAVCKDWCHLTSTTDFLLAHHQHQPSLPLVSFHGKTEWCNNDNVDAAFDALDLRRCPTVRQPVLRFNDYNHRRRFTVHATCDGLILLSLSNGRHYLCNPATRKWIPEPRLNRARVAAMYLHGPSGEYRILYWKEKVPINVMYHVLTVSSPAVGPRCVSQLIASLLVEVYLMYGLVSTVRKAPPVMLHNCLHWICILGGQQEAIVVYHTVTESFRLMQPPADSHPLAQYQSFPFLLEMDGTLGICWGSDRMLKLSVLQDYEREVWSLKYQIEFPLVEMGAVVGNQFSGIIVSKDGDALIHCHLSHQLFHLDNKGKLLQKFRWDGMLPRGTGFMFKESLIKHAFLERRRRARSRQPRFFRGL